MICSCLEMLDVLSASDGYVKADKKTAEKQVTLHFGQYSDAAR
jgi:hypothetical protein